MGLKRVMWVRRYQGQCRALRPLGHQGYRLRSYKKDQPLCSGYTRAVPALGAGRAVPRGPCASACPAPVLCSVWRAWQGAVRSRFPPTWLGLHALWGLRAAGLVGGRPRGGGWPATVVRGVWCQALSLPRPPILWGGQPGYRDPCVPGAVGVGVGTQHRFHSARPCGPALLAVGRWKGVPGGGAFHRCQGRLRSGAPPPPTARPLGGLLGSATHVLWARVCGCGGPTLSPLPACPVGAACRGGGGGPSPWGVACHRCEGRLVSGAVPPPAARPLGRAAGAPRPVCPGCRRCGRGDPAPAPQRAPLRAGVARCGGGGRASPGGGAFHCHEGRLRSGAPPPPTARPLGGLLGSVTRVLRARLCGCGGPTLSPQPACPVGAACHGGGGGPSPGVVARHRCEGRLVSGAVPPPFARPLGRAAGVPRPVCPGCRRCGRGTEQRPHSVRPCGLALLAVGMAEGRPRGGCLPPL